MTSIIPGEYAAIIVIHVGSTDLLPLNMMYMRPGTRPSWILFDDPRYIATSDW